MDKPIRVLHVLGGLSLGGAESRIMDLYRSIDRDKVQFDFLLHQNGEQRIPEFYDKEVEELGGHIYLLPKFKVYNYFQYKKAIRRFFKEHHGFAALQGHMTSTASIYLKEARKAGIPVLAAHARSAGVDRGIKGLLTRWLRLPLLKRADYCFACSKEAGRAVFGKRWYNSSKAYVIPNAIDTEKFIYNEKVRNEIRKELHISDCYVIGHVGRFHYAKNHEFLIEIFAELHSRLKEEGKRAVLMLLGEGAGMEAVKRQADELKLTEDVLFMGNKKDVWNYYQGMDYFVFPSRFEGLPGTVVEAQCAGLSCLISDRITPEVGISGLVSFISIEQPAACWAEHIIKRISYERRDMRQVIKNAGFDIREQAAEMEHFYLTGKMESERYGK